MSFHPKAIRLIRFSLQCTSVTLLYYDYLLTFPAEVKLIWQKPFRWTSILYFFCRYALLANLLYLLAMQNMLGSHVSRWYMVIAYSSIAGRAAVLTIWTTRTWAVWERNHWILVVLVPMVLAVVGLDILSETPGESIASNRALGILVVVHEWLSAGLTIYRCVVTMKDHHSFAVISRTSIYQEVLEQGALYILAVSVFTLGGVILAFVAPPGFLQGLLTPLTLPISGLLTARFILHMREISEKDEITSNHSFMDHELAPSRPIAFNVSQHDRYESGGSVSGPSSTTLTSPSVKERWMARNSREIRDA